MAEQATLRYELALETRRGVRSREWATEQPVEPGDLLLVGDRYWLVDRVEAPPSGQLPLAAASPARYRLCLRHPDGGIEAGVFRRLRPGAPRFGHVFGAAVGGELVSWQVVDERLARDEQGAPYLELVAERDYGELEGLPDHELEHALARRDQEAAAGAAREAPPRAGAMELVALRAGQPPDWDGAAAAIDALALVEVGEDVLERCGVDPDNDPREGWLETVKQRLQADLARFRDDVEGDQDEIEEWDVDGTRVFVSTGDWADEADPDKGHGWMCRLADSGILAAAGFRRVRKAEL